MTANTSKQGPIASRPRMPGYGISTSRKGLLPWSWARERLERSHNYFVGSTRPDGRPHVMPVWGVWHGDAFYFSTGRESRKARNLVRNPSCVVCAERADEAVIVEGKAAEIAPAKIPAAVRKAYRAKYKYALDPQLGPVFRVAPEKVFGFIEQEEKFATAATRWEFGQ
jgi:hypothetical protein